MSWDSYIGNLMGNDFVKDAAIVGHESKSESVWASFSGGLLKNITVEEIKALVGKDRSKLYSSGVFLGGTKSTLLRDGLTEDAGTMDLRTKATSDDPNTYSICIGKCKKALVIVQAKQDVHGGKVNKVAFDMAEYLGKSGF